MELGKVQKEWIKSLRKHPERQAKGILGKLKVDGSYKACCLGELLCAESRVNKKKLPFDEKSKAIIDSPDEDEMLDNSWERLGLFSPVGKLQGQFDGHLDLANANDSGKTWTEIADFIEANPEKVFTKSV